MGIKLISYEGVSTIPVKCINGELAYTFGGKTYTTYIPELKTQDFELQRNAYTSSNILAYLTNNTYKLILYFSGVCCVMLKDTLFRRFEFILPELPNLEVIAGIPVIQADHEAKNMNATCRVYKERNTNNAILYSSNCNTAFEFDIDDNLGFVSDFKAPVAYPSLVLEKGELVKQHEPGSFDYKLKGVLHYSEIIIL